VAQSLLNLFGICCLIIGVVISRKCKRLVRQQNKKPEDGHLEKSLGISQLYSEEIEETTEICFCIYSILESIIIHVRTGVGQFMYGVTVDIDSIWHSRE